MDAKQTPPSPAPLDAATLRILDANRNRAAEGLRVVEDYCRFALGDGHLTQHCKQLRHDLAAALATVPEFDLLAARETLLDVGTTLSTTQEGVRETLAGVCAASWHRTQQALRVIEECLKLSNRHAAATIEGLRYRAYTLSKATANTADSQARLNAACLYVLVDGGRSECAFVERIQSLIDAGVHILQLRDKTLDDRTLLSRARLLRRVLNERDQERARGRGGERETSTQLPILHAPPLLVVNDRPDLAVLAQADGVHVGQDELPVHDVRQIVGPQMLVGVSTHSIEQARQAVLDGANYIGCGPVFPSKTKSFDQFPGVDFLRQVAAEISLPAFAIGGITRQNLSQVLETGIRRTAIGGAIATSSDVLEAARAFASKLAS